MVNYYDKRTFFKILFFIIITHLILHITSTKFIIKPCDNNLSCRSNKISYISDCNRRYVYNKEYVDPDPSTEIQANHVDPHLNNCMKCDNFIHTLIVIICGFTLMNLILTQSVLESILIFTSMLLFFIIYPSITLHAANSNEYTDVIIKDENGKNYKYVPKIISTTNNM